MDAKKTAIVLVIGLLIGTGTGYGVNLPNISRLQTQIDSLKTETDKIPDLEQQITTLTDEKTSLQAQASNLQSQLDSMGSEKISLQAQIESLQSQITAKDDEVASLINQVQQLQDELIRAYTRVEWADTLNLEKLAALGLNYVNGSRNYLSDPPMDQYFFVGLLSDPPKMWMPRDFHEGFTEAAILLHNMTDSEKGEEIEALYKRCYYDESSGVMNQIPLSISTFEPILAWYSFTKDEYIKDKIRQRLNEAVVETWKVATVSEEEKYAYMPPRGGGSEIEGENLPTQLNDWTLRQGCLIGPLVRWYELSGNGSALKLATYLANWIVYHTDLIQENGSFTLAKSESEKEPSGYDFKGHVTSRIDTAAGIIRCGIATNDIELVKYGKKMVDYVDELSRGTGSSSFGYFPENVMQIGCETCSIRCMIDCMILLTKAGYPEYWNLVERAARNQLVENQLRDVEWVESTKYLDDTREEIYNNVAERVKGGWAGWSTPNDWVGLKTFPESPQIMCCCVKGSEALYLVWSNIVTKDDEGVWVNLLLNKATRWVDVNSYSPYEGRVEVTVKNASDLFIRLPEWVDKSKVAVTVDDASQTFSWRGDYVQLGDLMGGQEVSVTYPLRQLTETFYLIPEKGSPMESNRYTITWKGDTVISISPKGQYYPLYQRGYYESDEAPMVKYNYTITGN
jgi:flagellar biosynthesis chaperone FliJ